MRTTKRDPSPAAGDKINSLPISPPRPESHTHHVQAVRDADLMLREMGLTHTKPAETPTDECRMDSEGPWLIPRLINL